MSRKDTSRRAFLKTVTASTVLAIPAVQSDVHAATSRQSSAPSGVDILRRPDRIAAWIGSGQSVQLQFASRKWSGAGIEVSTEPVSNQRNGELPVIVSSPTTGVTHLHLWWKGRQKDSVMSIGDHWERSYGDLEWRGTVPERVMPWYFLTFDGSRIDGYGVKTQPAAFCFWQRDTEGISLWIDLRNGGNAASLGNRELRACTIVSRKGTPDEPKSHAMREFCSRMCPAPRLPPGPIYGSNDWNYAYGKNTSAGILRDADLIASLAPAGKDRPTIVIDDGWQDRKRFPSMPELAAGIRSRNLRPGMWIRPLRADASSSAPLLLPQSRFGRNSERKDLAFDPTIPEALEKVLETVTSAVQWGYEFIKHDFSTYELFGRWGSEMGAQPTLPGWHFYDRSRTNAEIVLELYRSIRRAAGEKTIILGCNTVGHLAAGLFESQRIGDDTSGHDWERTRRYGVNTLAHRIAQHRTFSCVDPDIVAITPNIDWRQTSQWLDVVARSGTSLFIAPNPESITPEVKSALRDAMALSAEGASGVPVNCLASTTPEEWEFQQPVRSTRRYKWDSPEGVSPFAV